MTNKNRILVITKMQIKTSVRYFFTSIKMAIIKKYITDMNI